MTRALRMAAAAVLAGPGTAFAAPAADAAHATVNGGPLSDVLILLGSVFLLAAAVGVLRFPDVYIRLHAATKLVTLGGLGIFGGAAIAFAEVGASERVLLVAAFFFLTAPLSGYMIARSGYLRGLTPVREASSVDEWGACGSAAPTDGDASGSGGHLPSSRDASRRTR